VRYLNNTVFNTLSNTVSNTVLNEEEKEYEEHEKKALAIALKYGLNVKQYKQLVETLKNARKQAQKRPRIVRSFREFLFCVNDEKIAKVLDKFSISGMQRSDYIALSRAILKDMCNKIIFAVAENKEKVMDRIVKYNVRYFSKRVILREDVTKQCITVLYSILYDVEKLKWEYIHRCEKEGLPFIYTRGSK